MPDYAADPLWNARTECMVRLDTIPVSDTTKNDVRAWAQRWEQLIRLPSARTHFDAVDDTRSSTAEPDALGPWEQLEHDARALCERLRDELGEQWRIGHVTFKGRERHVQWQTDGPVERFPVGSGRTTGNQA